MLLGKDATSGRRILPADVTPETRAVCPSCDGELIPKRGRRVIHHFAHSPDAACPDAGHGESPAHLAMKRSASLLLPGVVLEVPVRGPDETIIRRIDAAALTAEGPLALEFQASPLSPHDWSQRTRDLTAAGYTVAWFWDASRLTRHDARHFRVPDVILASADSTEGQEVAFLHHQDTFYAARLLPPEKAPATEWGRAERKTLRRVVATPLADLDLGPVGVPGPAPGYARQIRQCGLAVPPAARIAMPTNDVLGRLDALEQEVLEHNRSSALWHVDPNGSSPLLSSTEPGLTTWEATDDPNALHALREAAALVANNDETDRASIAALTSSLSRLHTVWLGADTDLREARARLHIAEDWWGRMQTRLKHDITAAADKMDRYTHLMEHPELETEPAVPPPPPEEEDENRDDSPFEPHSFEIPQHWLRDGRWRGVPRPLVHEFARKVGVSSRMAEAWSLAYRRCDRNSGDVVQVVLVVADHLRGKLTAREEDQVCRLAPPFVAKYGYSVARTDIISSDQFRRLAERDEPPAPEPAWLPPEPRPVDLLTSNALADLWKQLTREWPQP